MKKLLLSLLFISGFAASGYAQIFSQNFNSSTNVSDYVDVAGVPNKFTGTSSANATPTNFNVISAANNSIRFTKTGSSNGYFARITNLTPVASTVLKVSFSFQLSGNTNTTTSTTEAQFYVGNGFSNSASAPSNANTNSKLVFHFDSQNTFSVASSTAPQTPTAGFSTKQNLIWIINNSGSDITYKAPDGTTSKTLATNRWDLYIGASSSTPVLSDRLAVTNGVPLQNFYFRYENDAENGTIEIDDIVINDQTTTLPVSLTSFTAKANLQNIDLAWATASEKDNSYFDILRSGDGKTFTKIGDVKGNGTTDIAKNYTFTDKNALPGVNYYQLKQVDYNGTSTLSKVEAVKSNVAASNLKVSASKQDGTVKLTVFAANEGNATFKIYDLNGRKITERVLNLSKGYSNVSVPFNGGNGLHIASLTTATETVTQKFIQ